MEYHSDSEQPYNSDSNSSIASPAVKHHDEKLSDIDEHVDKRNDQTTRETLQNIIDHQTLKLIGMETINEELENDLILSKEHAAIQAEIIKKLEEKCRKLENVDKSPG